MRNTSLFRAFTLVELIVVITIVGILSTIGFVSYSGYLTWARDSNRISQLTKLSDSLQVYSASKTLPLPDNAINITASWTLIAYQWEVWVDVLETIDFTNGWKDPKDDQYYSYYLTKDRNSIQLMALMEEANAVALNQTQTTNAVNFEERFPKVYGRKLWILTYDDDSNPELKNTPANQVAANSSWLDIVTTNTVYTWHISDERNDKITWTGSSLAAINSKASCKRIKQTWWASGNGVYTISPVWIDLEVYCDMEVDWGGWTLVARSVSGETWDFGIWAAWSLSDFNTVYQYWWSLTPIIHSQVMLATYTSQRNISNVSIVENSWFTFSVVTPYTLRQWWITWWSSWDWFNWEQWMLFVK